MKHPEGPAAPASGTTPTFEELAADPEIAALLDFAPVPMSPRVNGWDAEAQRAYIALLAMTGSKTRAVTAIGRKTASLDNVLKRPDAASFADAHDRALDLFRRRESARLGYSVAAQQRRDPNVQAPDQVLNEHGEYEDEESYRQRGDEAMDSISAKMRNARRLFLEEIAPDPAKRAAFEILTEFKIDWEKAARREAQIDEPWRKPRMREPDMLLTAENGWLGEFMHGPDRKAELLGEINAWRAERGLDPVVWEGE